MDDDEKPGKRRRENTEWSVCIKDQGRSELEEATMVTHIESLERGTYREVSEMCTNTEVSEINRNTEAPEINTNTEAPRIESPEINIHREALETDAYKEAPEMGAHSKSPELNSHKERSEKIAYKEVPKVNAYENVPTNTCSETRSRNTSIETSDVYTSSETYGYRVVPDINEYTEALVQIANFFDQNKNGRHFHPSRPSTTEWKLQRVCTIRVLKELKEKLDTMCIISKIENPVANGSTSDGAVGSFAGTTKSFFGLTCSPWVTNIGSGLASIPLVANIGRSLVHNTGIGSVSNKIESQISEKYLRKIEAALEEDRTLLRPLAEWLNRSNKLDAKVQEIFGVSLISGKFYSVIKVFNDILLIADTGRSFEDIINHLKQGEYSAYIGDLVSIEKLQKFHLCLSSSPNLVDKIRRVISTLNAEPEEVKIFVDGVRAFHSIMGTSPDTIQQGGRNHEIAATNTAEEVCVLRTIKLALSVVSLINGASIIRRGTSQYSEPLNQLISSLAWELERMENM